MVTIDLATVLKRLWNVRTPVTPMESLRFEPFRVFANGPGDLGSIPGRVIPKTQ